MAGFDPTGPYDVEIADVPYGGPADAYFDRALAACGLVVVALDFRQAPAHRYPSAVADIVAGVRFVKANADRLGVTPMQVGLIGGSSGGHGGRSCLRQVPERGRRRLHRADAPFIARRLT